MRKYWVQTWRPCVPSCDVTAQRLCNSPINILHNYVCVLFQMIFSAVP